MRDLHFSRDPRFSAIAVTGGPCAGKSTFLANARTWLEDRGLSVAVLSEGATDLIMSGLPPWAAWHDPSEFQRFLLRHNKSREDLFYEMLSALKGDKPKVLLCDRGLLDALAYVPREIFLWAVETLGYDVHALRERYRAVLHLVTAADGAEEHYTLANNAARTESPEQARQLDRKTQAAWLGHQHLILIDNTAPTFDAKMQRALSALARVLQMPAPLEKERKYLVLSHDPARLPHGVVVEIEQTYLIAASGVGERRVRLRRIDGAESYYYTEKDETGIAGQRVERERQISRREFEALLKERDPAAQTIKKRRHSFTHDGHHFEMDSYHEPLSELVVLECEVEDLDAPLSLPPGIEAREVTGDSMYSNWRLARWKGSQQHLFV